MSKSRRSAKPLPEKHEIPFLDAQEAWFWFMDSMRARVDGARQRFDASLYARPCEPDDLYRLVMGLRRAGLIHDAHLRVLAAYGWRGAPPDPRVSEEVRAERLWDEAVDRLTTALKARGLIDDGMADHIAH